MKFYVDGNLACSANMWWSGGGAFPVPFNQPFYAILNLAVGGNWPVSSAPQYLHPAVLMVAFVLL
jgi:hypothetical protein